MIDIEALRKKVIDLAIQGKLTQQLPEDGNAEELYAQIQEEKAKLIKEGKIKKESPLPEISQDEIPFEIPSGWKWTRMFSVVRKITDGTHHSPVNEEYGDYMYVTAKNIKAKGVVLDNITFVSADVHEEIFRRCDPEKNDVLLVKDGATTGVVTVNNIEVPFSLLSSVALIKPTSFIESWYLAYLMRSTWFCKFIKKEMTGVGITRIVLKQIETFLVPLPPLAEQKRIVERIEEVLSQIDIIDTLQQQYESDREILKGKIIDAGIRGKLTAQLPEDGDAEDLYAQIQEEKAKLIKDGKIKKEKPLPPVSEDEIPFEIPISWKWTRLNSLAYIINGDRGKNYPAKNTLSNVGIPFISALNLNGKNIDVDDRLLCLSDEQYSRLGNGKLEKDDVVVCIRGSLGKHGKFQLKKGAIASSLVICRPYQLKDILGSFLMVWLDSSLFPMEIDKYDGGSAQPNLAAENLKKFIVPLPPLAEQTRIVEIINQVILLMGK